MLDEQLPKIIDFWFSDYARQRWFAKDQEFDQYVRDNFLSTYFNELKKFNIQKISNPTKALGLILLFDQFPRNMFRGKKEAFDTDNLALSIAKLVIEQKYDYELNTAQKKFIYMPFMHSEDLEDQETCVELFSSINDEMSLDYAKKHLEIIEKFHRFPHRNIALSRTSTVEEIKFLKLPGSSF